MHNVTQTNVMMLTGILAMSVGAHFHHDLILVIGVLICVVSLYRYIRS